MSAWYYAFVFKVCSKEGVCVVVLWMGIGTCKSLAIKNSYIIFGEILQSPLPLWKDKSSAEELPVVPTSLHQHAISYSCRKPTRSIMNLNVL